MTKQEKLVEKVINYVRTTKKAGCSVTRTRKIYAAIRNGMIRVQVWSDSESASYPMLDYEVTL